MLAILLNQFRTMWSYLCLCVFHLSRWDCTFDCMHTYTTYMHVLITCMAKFDTFNSGVYSYSSSHKITDHSSTQIFSRVCEQLRLPYRDMLVYMNEPSGKKVGWSMKFITVLHLHARLCFQNHDLCFSSVSAQFVYSDPETWSNGTSTDFYYALTIYREERSWVFW